MAKAAKTLIVQDGKKGSDILHQTADLVPLAKIQTPEIKEILKSMTKILDKAPDGVALAAPQIGVPLRIFMVKSEALRKKEDTDKRIKPNLIFINPVVTKRSRETEWMDEGCLSVQNWFGRTKRSTKATVKAYDEKGKLFERGGSGLLAQIFQHETDHLNGRLFTEHAVDLIEFRPEERKKPRTKANA